MKPRALDLFCKAGGASMGLHRAGFDVEGVDCEPQKHYPFKFHLGDALEADLTGFDLVWASPPCQAYTVAAHNERKRGKQYPDLLAATRAKLEASGLPWIIENVPGAPMRADVVLCGSMFGLPIVRHRLFELSHGAYCLVSPCSHGDDIITVCGHGTPSRSRRQRMKRGLHPNVTVDMKRSAMGIEWMNRDELAQAIPPAYSEFLGRQILKAIGKL